jgi:hypothetical protein
MPIELVPGALMRSRPVESARQETDIRPERRCGAEQPSFRDIDMTIARNLSLSVANAG